MKEKTAQQWKSRSDWFLDEVLDQGLPQFKYPPNKTK